MLALVYYFYGVFVMQNAEFVEYLEKKNFKKRLDELSKKLKGKKIVIYGAGIFFQAINTMYDLSGLNIVAISDKKFSEHTDEQTFLGYKVCAPEEIQALNPDYVLLATKNIISIIDDLESNLLKHTNIKIRSLVKKSFKELWDEIWF